MCTAYEMVMPDGSVIWCDKDQHQKLYISMPFSYGTLGFLTAVDIKIVPYKPYVKHTYIPVSSVKEGVEVFEREINNPLSDTVEGIMFSKTEGVIMSGRFEETLQVNLNKYFSILIQIERYFTFFSDFLKIPEN